MTFNKKKQDQYKFKLQPNEKRVFNNLHVAETNPWKNFYAFITINGKDIIETYEGKFRVEAIQYFNEFARLNGGNYNGNLQVLKN